jgi:hypothetical protein
MGQIYGNVAMYSVHFIRGGALLVEAFEGDHAYTNASDFLECLRANDDVTYISMARLDGGEWKYVQEPLERKLGGEWQPKANHTS